jgi:hypothetical protein
MLKNTIWSKMDENPSNKAECGSLTLSLAFSNLYSALDVLLGPQSSK